MCLDRVAPDSLIRGDTSHSRLAAEEPLLLLDVDRLSDWRRSRNDGCRCRILLEEWHGDSRRLCREAVENRRVQVGEGRRHEAGGRTEEGSKVVKQMTEHDRALTSSGNLRIPLGSSPCARRQKRRSTRTVSLRPDSARSQTSSTSSTDVAQ